MSSDSMQHRLCDYIEGTLSAEDRSRLEAALANDPALRADLESIRALYQHAEQWHSQSLPPGWRPANPFRGHYQAVRSWWLPVLSSALSFLLLLGVLLNLSVRFSEEGLVVDLGTRPVSALSREELLVLLDDWQARQQSILQDSLASVRLQNRIDDQSMLLRAVELARMERNAKISQLLQLMDKSRTNDHLNFYHLLESEKKLTDINTEYLQE